MLPLLTGEGRTHHAEILTEATRLSEAVQLVPVLDPRRFTMDTVEGAYRAVSDGTVRGKVVVDISEASR